MATEPLPTQKIIASDAIKRIKAQYELLVRTSREAIAESKRAGKKIPLGFIDGYHRAVNEYLRFGRDVIAAMAAQRLTLEQVLMGSDGNPLKDVNGRPRTIKLAAPLRPPTFTLPAGRYPSVTRVSGVSGSDEMGVLPVVAVVFLVTAIVATGAVVVVNTGLLDKFVLMFQGYPPPDIAKTIEAAKAAGLSPEQTVALAKQQQEDYQKQQENRGIGLGGVLTAGLAVAGLAIIVPQLTKRG